MLKTRVLPFEYQVFKKLSSLKADWSESRVLIALSGGRDSMILLNVLQALQSRLKFELVVAYVHHGKSSNQSVTVYRRRAAAFVRKQAKDRNLKFELLTHSGAELKSEADFRKERERLLERCRKNLGCEFIAYGHHSDDLLETRLIRLIRGTGAQGLQSMALAHGHKLRPLLSFSSAELEKYSDHVKLKWVVDPTNEADHYFRNWIRNTWLPILELKRAGSKQALGRSLEQIAETLSQQPQSNSEMRLEVIKRKEFGDLNQIEKREVVARLLLDRGARDFSRRQIDEILKRLSSLQATKRRNMTFEVAGLEWRVNAEQIEAVRL